MAPDATPTGRTQYMYMRHDIHTGGVGVVGGFAARRLRRAARCILGAPSCGAPLGSDGEQEMRAMARSSRGKHTGYLLVTVVTAGLFFSLPVAFGRCC